MKKTAIFIITLVILFLSAAVAMAEEKLISYTNDEYHFMIKYPASQWSEMNPPIGNAVWEISNNTDSGMYITVLDFDGKQTDIWKVDIEAFAAGFINGLKKKLPESELIDVQKTHWADNPAIIITYKIKDGTMVLDGTQYACIHNKKVYIITYESLENVSQERKKQFEPIAQSFTFTDK